MSKYSDQTHPGNLDCVGQLEIGQAGYLLNHPRSRNPTIDHKTRQMTPVKFPSDFIKVNDERFINRFSLHSRFLAFLMLNPDIHAIFL